MLKIVGSVLVIMACTLAGRGVARTYAERPRQLRYWQSALLELEAEIVYGAVPLSQALSRLKVRGDPLVAGFYEQVVTELTGSRGATMGEVWHKVLQRWQEKTCLTSDDVDILATLGKALGTSDRQQQQKHLLLAREQLALEEAKAWDTAARTVKPWNYFGLLGGMAIVLILI
ncbi:MAG TPA: stage III sporulation protein AB [Bacillota bacterium]|nr:stage III sporulation protein AB [Bacillota bacterium]